MSKICEDDLLKLSESLYALIWRPTKDDTEVLGAQLRHRAHNFDYDNTEDRENLFVAITCAECASGPASRKEYWIRRFESVWLPLESRFMEAIAQGAQREAEAAGKARIVIEMEV